MSIAVLKPGLQTSIQDRGRDGFAAIGVGASGPMDSTLFRLGQALVGNDERQAALEITVIGPSLRFHHDHMIALTGDFSRPRIDGIAVECWQPLFVEAGSELDCGPLRNGTRGYLAVAGGIGADIVLGSRATDINARIGPNNGQGLRAGDSMSLGSTASRVRPSTTLNWSLDPTPWFDTDASQPIHWIAGRHRDALDDASLRALEHEEFKISADSNRVGFRLDGPSLRLRESLELISEPVNFGTVQLPGSGQLIALMAEHPTTGGYPCIAQIAAVDLGRLAQRRPGERVRFALISLEDAQSRYLAQEQRLRTLIAAVRERIGK
ncbi:MAG: biotin-dependent carboxyltransferase family protein [Dokdonella sp.]